MPQGVTQDHADPGRLLDHASRLLRPQGSGRRPTSDTRRAISAAYYGAYHCVTGAAAKLLFDANALHGVRWLTHSAVDGAGRLVTQHGPKKAADPGHGPEVARVHGLWTMFQAIGGASDELLEAVEVLRALKAERERADYDRINKLSPATGRALVADARWIVKLFSSARVKQDDFRIYLSLVALKA